MSRLWRRVGVFRMLSIFLLVLGVVGGIYLGTGRQTQQRISASGHSVQAEQAEMRQLKQDIAERQRASAAARAAQREAQAKAEAAAAAAAAKAKAAEEAARKSQAASRSETRTATTTPKPSIPTSCNSYSGNKAIGCALMLQWGYGMDQMPCLENMWQKESGWNHLARNPSSGAYGIPQALPGTKMAVYGSDWQTNPVPQIKWGLDYIKGRYKSPCGAWNFWQNNHWY